MRGAFCSVHTHSRMCDGKNTLAEMAQAAFEAGAVSFGASGHSHTPLPEDEGEVLPADMTAYRAEVLRLREEYAGRMDVLLGIELDNLADVTAEGFDYWIGSAHHMRDREGGWHAVDWDRETLERIVRENNKQRYAFNEDHTKIRANQGHSVQVDVELTETRPPKYLYHGTATRFYPAIQAEGIRKMSRQYVHLSGDFETAMAVGKRHGIPMVVTINAAAMAACTHPNGAVYEYPLVVTAHCMAPSTEPS